MEAICLRTPLLLMPIFAEQPHSAHMLLAARVVRSVNKYELNGERLSAEINEVGEIRATRRRASTFQVLDNPHYASAVARVHSRLLDRPLAPLERAKFFIERAIRRPHRQIVFRRRSVSMLWVKFLYAELFIFFVGLCLFIK